MHDSSLHVPADDVGPDPNPSTGVTASVHSYEPSALEPSRGPHQAIASVSISSTQGKKSSENSAANSWLLNHQMELDNIA